MKNDIRDRKEATNLKKITFFRRLVVTSIVLIYLIIIAGAVVRMTGSGMGCPDWPKCFGYYIPPTEKAQIQWQPNHEYEKGTIVILDQELRIASKGFRSGHSYNTSNWKPYTKHEYATFNVWHTWIEYINRLVTIISGIPILLMFIISFRYWKTKRSIPLLAIITIIAMLFQAWLGKEVVDSNLLPIRITIHMVVAFVILALLLAILYKTNNNSITVSIPKSFQWVFVFSVVLTLVQVALGTQVRQYVDEQIKTIGEHAKSQWLDPPTITFYIHRSFSVLVVLVSSWLFFQYKKLNLEISKLHWVLVFIVLEAFTGTLMYYFDFPFLSQPIHLVLAALLFGIQFYIFLEVFSTKTTLSKATNSV